MAGAVCRRRPKPTAQRGRAYGRPSHDISMRNRGKGMTNEIEYRRVVDEAIKNQTDMPISNGKPEHAVYLIQKILRNAKEVVRVFSGKLARNSHGVPVYGGNEILAATRDFLGRGGRIKVLLEKPIDVDKGQMWTDHPLVKMVHSIPQGKDLLEVKKAPENLINELRDTEVLYHWITMDKQAYRLELDTTRAKAIANFGNPKTAQVLVAIFDQLFAQSEHYSPPEPQYV